MFLASTLVAIYFVVPLVFAPAVRFDTLKAAAFLTLFLPAVAIWLFWASDGWRPLGTSDILAPLGCLAGISSLSLIGAPSWRLAIPPLFWLLTLCLFLLFLTDVLRRPGVIELLSRVVCIATILLAAFGIFQFYDLFNVEASYPIRPNLFSTIGNPNPASNFVASALPIMGALMLASKGFRGWVWGAAITLCYAFLLMAQSRSNLLALGLGAGFGLLAGWRTRVFTFTRGKASGLVWLTVALAIVTWIYSVPNPLNRRVSLFDRARATFVPGTGGYSSGSLRLMMLDAVQRMVRDHPFLGVGIGNFPAVSAEYLGRVQADSGSRQEVGFWWEAHNEYLQILAELGPLGLLAFLGLVIPPVIRGVRSVPTLSPPAALSVLGATSGLVVFLADSWFNFPLRNPPNVLLFLFLLGTILALIPNARDEVSGCDSSADRNLGGRMVPPPVSSAVSKLRAPIAIVCAAILAAGTGFAWGHIAAELFVVKAKKSAELGDIQGAVRAYRRARHLAPFKWDVPVALGTLHASSGHPTEAIEALADAERFVKQGSIARVLGVAYALLGRFDGAQREYRRALFYDPGDLLARFGLALAYRDAGDYRGAATEARIGLRLNPLHGHLRYALGTSMARLGQIGEAFGQLAVAGRLRESDREIMVALEEVAGTVGRPDLVMRAQRRLAAIATVAEAERFRRTNIPAAESWLAAARRRDADFAYPYFELGRLYFDTSRPDLALRAFQTYVDKAPIGEKAGEAGTYIRVIEYPSLLARLLGRDPRFDVGI